VWQSIRLQREPFETEINEEVEKEYQRLEGERAGEEQSAEKSIAEMATRMEELEAKLDASNERLEAKIDASQSRLEAMFQQLLAARSAMNCTPPPSLRETTAPPGALCYQFWPKSLAVARRRRKSRALN
jgi:hypothetical protein